MKWILKHGETVLGTLTEFDSDMWNIHCHFEPTAEFAVFRDRFVRKAELADQIDGADQALIDEFVRLEAETAPPALRLFDEAGEEMQFGLLYLDGDNSGFRGILP
jgi:hypothetical protein